MIFNILKQFTCISIWHIWHLIWINQNVFIKALIIKIFKVHGTSLKDPVVLPINNIFLFLSGYLLLRVSEVLVDLGHLHTFFQEVCSCDHRIHKQLSVVFEAHNSLQVFLIVHSRFDIRISIAFTNIVTDFLAAKAFHVSI
jgi:hypothetical protein